MGHVSPLERNKILPTEFISAIVHELKTPLNSIIGLSDLLKEKLKAGKSSDECEDCARDISLVAVEMNELVQDILDVESATLCGGFSADLSKEIDIKNIVQRSIKLNYDYSLKRNITLKTEISGDISPINLDAKRMKQILTNLISNSLKYSPQKTEIKISAQNICPLSLRDTETRHESRPALQGTPSRMSMGHTGNILLNEQADQGFGMTPSQVETAFEKYQTIENPNSGKVDSFGLGLPIVKQLVELQNGTIEVRSELNKGTEVKLKFPYFLM